MTTAIVGACLAVAAPGAAAEAGLTLMKRAAERAAPRSDGPGSYAVALIDSLPTRSRMAGDRMRRAHDLRVYYVTDAPLSQRLGLIETTLEAVRGGATLVQLRHPRCQGRRVAGSRRGP